MPSLAVSKRRRYRISDARSEEPLRARLLFVCWTAPATHRSSRRGGSAATGSRPRGRPCPALPWTCTPSHPCRSPPARALPSSIIGFASRKGYRHSFDTRVVLRMTHTCLDLRHCLSVFLHLAVRCLNDWQRRAGPDWASGYTSPAGSWTLTEGESGRAVASAEEAASASVFPACRCRGGPERHPPCLRPLCLPSFPTSGGAFARAGAAASAPRPALPRGTPPGRGTDRSAGR